MKKILRKIIYQVPIFQKIWFWLRDFITRPNFSGWGMKTIVYPPWVASREDALTRDFFNCALGIRELVMNKRFTVSQFEEVYDKGKLLDGLLWRHYLVYWSARYAAERTSSQVKTLVECGVCDGLTVHFALSAVSKNFPVEAHLYDSWEGMREDFLVDSEKIQSGNYSYLEMNRTKDNLSANQNNLIFHKGFIPESFQIIPSPDEVTWLHIDLNASIPTRQALEEFFPRVQKGGIIIFDDYLGKYYPDTKIAIDQFFSGKEGILLPLPTGQAIFFK
jgi:hypothetical protein